MNIPKTVQRNVPLAAYTTFKIGGPAEYLAAVASEDDLIEALAWARAASVAVTMLGGGSNMLVSDAGVSGLTIKNEIGGMAFDELDDGTLQVTAGAGVVWDDLVAESVRRGVWGLENLSAIPGTVGATPIQNVGAYGVEIADVIRSVRVYDQRAQAFATLDRDTCAFGYRDSLFKHEEGRRYVVCSVTFALSREANRKLAYKDLAEHFDKTDPTLDAIRTAVINIRSKKFPDWHRIGTAGSFFKNPVITEQQYADLRSRYSELPGYRMSSEQVKIPLGWILDHALGLRGVRDGAVGTFDAQALVLVNWGEGTAREVDAFARMIEARVYDATGITLEREVTHVGEADMSDV